MLLFFTSINITVMRPKMLLVSLLLLFLGFLTGPDAIAQERTVSGTVLSVDGQALVGVTVHVAGTSNGTTTDENGHYSLQAKTGHKLEFSSIGYITQTITLADQTTLDVKLKENTKMLGETVVTALGVER